MGDFMKKCYNCGNENTDESQYCDNCGTTLKYLSTNSETSYQNNFGEFSIESNNNYKSDKQRFEELESTINSILITIVIIVLIWGGYTLLTVNIQCINEIIRQDNNSFVKYFCSI